MEQTERLFGILGQIDPALIAAETGMKESRVKMILHRTRERLREHLIRDGIEL